MTRRRSARRSSTAGSSANSITRPTWDVNSNAQSSQSSSASLSHRITPSANWRRRPNGKFHHRSNADAETTSRFDRRGGRGRRDLQNDEPHRARGRTNRRDFLYVNRPGKPVFYLFHDPADQDEGCRRIYSFADRAERELAGKIEVRRPDVKSEKSVAEKYQVRVLPTILVVGADDAVKERFEGEEKEAAARSDKPSANWKTVIIASLPGDSAGHPADGKRWEKVSS